MGVRLGEAFIKFFKFLKISIVKNNSGLVEVSHHCSDNVLIFLYVSFYFVG